MIVKAMIRVGIVALLWFGAQTQSFALDGIALPVVLYQPETSLVLGGGVTLLFRDDADSTETRPDHVNTYFIYSLKNQLSLYVEPNYYFGGSRWELKIVSEYEKFPDSFFGIGNDTGEDDEESYTTEDIVIQPWLVRRLYRSAGIGLLYDLKRTSVLETEDGGMLEGGLVPGVGGGWFSGLGAVLDWDSRDNIFAPETGEYCRLYGTFYRDYLGSDFEYESYTLDLRKYLSLRPGHVIALQLLGKSLVGDIAFNRYATLSKMRGILASRFRDRKMVMGQVEYRFPINDRFSGALFSAAGDVADTFDALNARDMKFSFGLGLRYMFDREERTKIRLDVGFSRYGVYPYIQVFEAF